MLGIIIRIGMTAAHRVRVRLWGIRKSRAVGLHAVPLTPAGKVVLVRLTYAPGWHVPGGGQHRGEPPQEGALRECREEIGLRSWSRVTGLAEREGETWGRPHRLVLFLVEGAIYQPPRWSLEIADVAEFAWSALPPDLSAPAAAMLRIAADALAGKDTRIGAGD